MSYESPIELIVNELQTQMEGDVLKAVQNYGINVNKEELLKALDYDRDQYRKGYEDGRKNKKRIIMLVLETDSQRMTEVLLDDLKQEISCCWNDFNIKSLTDIEI